MDVHIRVSHDDFDTAAEIARYQRPGIGAVTAFVGLVRDFGDGDNVVALELEHYPGMTESALAAIIDDAGRRWPLDGVTVIHRVGRLELSERIVLVVTASAHRRAAFEGCEFVMDWLKTRAPFWKREWGADGQSRWVDAKDSDDSAAARWEDTPK